MKKMLLISNSYCYGQGFLDHCAAAIEACLRPATSVVFLPYAKPDWEAYTNLVRERFGLMGIAITGIQEFDHRVDELLKAEAIFIGGGNTYRLLASLYEYDLLPVIRNLVGRGTPYIGSSAGSNVAGPTIRTTNDWRIIDPPSMEALGLVPFQINPHFIDADPASKHMGEPREERIAEFHAVKGNEASVVGLREGSWIYVHDNDLALGGTTGAKIFSKGNAPLEWTKGEIRL